MRFSDVLFALFRLLFLPAIVGTTYLYLYPAISSCGFPNAQRASSTQPQDGTLRPQDSAAIAPFRLLALGDPQLEGDTSLPDPSAPWFPRLTGEWWKKDLRETGRVVVQEDLPRLAWSFRKRLDLWGNDLYLAHIYRSLMWWTEPTHTVVLGDLLGSQWIGDEEFERRTDRFWNTVFKHGAKVPQSITGGDGHIEPLGQDESWTRRVIAVAGNHDIGYSGDITEDRIKRFEDAFGRVNWDVKFSLNETGNPELHLIILNSMNLDEPALDPNLGHQSRAFLENKIHAPANLPRANTGTIVLTHIPLHKEAGICVDGPFFRYFPEEYSGGVEEQNHLSDGVSSRILEGLTGGERGHQSIILNGHDHEGCDTYHFSQDSGLASTASREETNDEEKSKWQATHYSSSKEHRQDEGNMGIREITVRSMMGEFGGNAGFLSAWFDIQTQEWRFEYSNCKLGVQHVWWAVHVLDIIEVTLGLLAIIVAAIERPRPSGKKEKTT